MDYYCIRSNTSGRYLTSRNKLDFVQTSRNFLKMPAEFFSTQQQAKERISSYKEICKTVLEQHRNDYPDSGCLEEYDKRVHEPLEIVKMTESVIG